MSWSDIPGRSAYLWIYDRFVKTAPKGAIVVEVGVALGKSISYLARKCIEAGRDDIVIYAVDPWAGYARNGEQQADGPPTEDGDYKLFLRTMEQHAPEELARIRIIRETSTEAAKHYFENGTVQLVVIDAAHDYSSVRADIDAWLPKVKAGGAIGGDDYEPEYQGVIDAVQETFNRPPFKIETRKDENWGTWLVDFTASVPFDPMAPPEEPAVP